MHGGWGYMWEYPISHAYVNARVQMIYGGSNEIMKELIARGVVAKWNVENYFGKGKCENRDEKYCAIYTIDNSVSKTYQAEFKAKARSDR